MRKFAEWILRMMRHVVQPFLKKPASPGVVSDKRTIGDDNYFMAVRMLLDEGKEVLFTPKGDSMLPFIKNGRDSVVLASLSRPLEVGDIILVKIGPKYIMHRIFALDGDRITLMGDGNIKGKEHCTLKDVIGIVTEIHKESGKVVKPGKGRFWRAIRPLRLFFLVFYKRVIL
ncbi:MAG: S24/S26 family peptidase [Bacteroidales bacterium]|nr:S24/S26 family peptidase [Bacteroidales bacterium]